MPQRPSLVRSALLLGLGLWCSAAAQAAPAVSLAGVLGGKALLVVDGAPPKGVAPGQTHQGVKVVSVSRDAVVVDINGASSTLRLGESPVNVGGSGAGRRIVLKGDSRGHFVNQGMINGRIMQFMVDTGATTVALGAPEAKRLGLRYENGAPVRMGTANGVAQGWRLRLDAVRIGDMEVRDVEAVVMPHALPFVLLGNSFLRGFQMSRNNEQMVLEKRP